LIGNLGHLREAGAGSAVRENAGSVSNIMHNR
jgi:hypothetical protein